MNFDISISDAWDLFLKQDKKCIMSGIDLSFSQKKAVASLDRIDSSKGYTVDNVQWVHKDINFMKQWFSDGYFKYLCNLIAKKNPLPVGE